MEHFDMIIVGAGISGIGAAYRLSTLCPNTSFTVLEARDSIGGTWDLWRYPGVRSDSDMFTFAYPFKPWDSEVMMASGGSILEYLKKAVSECGADRHIRCGHHVHEAAWSSEHCKWTVSTSLGTFTSSFLFLAAGYYEYDQGYNPEFKGKDRFQGQIINPICWPQDLDYAGKRMIVIGSGATAVSLVPKLAEQAGHVTMLQWSPSYMYATSNNQGLLHRVLRRFAPALASKVARWQHVCFYICSYWACRTFPWLAKFVLVRLVTRRMPGQDTKHFTPRYNPWDQRLCRVSDGDIFERINEGKVSIVTDHIDEFMDSGIRTTSGLELQADVVVSATGFNFMKNFPVGHINLSVDGNPYKPADAVAYKGCMLSRVPNLFYAIGYTNASWTLRTDLISTYMCRVLQLMARKGSTRCCPAAPESDVHLSEGGFGSLSSGYLERSKANLPRSGDRLPWYVPQYYLLDKWMLLWSACDDGILQFDAGSMREMSTSGALAVVSGSASQS